jgi:hypothetical protein
MLAYRETQALKVLREHRVRQVRKAPPALLVLKELREYREPKVFKERLELALKARLARKEILEELVYKAHKEHRGDREHKYRVQPEGLGLKELKDFRGQHKGCKVQLVVLDLKEPLVLREHKADRVPLRIYG